MIRAYLAIVDKYVEQNPHLDYAEGGPLFVNQKLEKFKDSKRTLNTTFISEIAEVAHVKPHDIRRMYATYVGNSKSLILRQYFAIASSHRYINCDNFRTDQIFSFIVLRLNKRPMCQRKLLSGGL